MNSSQLKHRHKSLDLFHLQTPNKSSNTIRRNLICLVCGSSAIGFNFGVLTCMCCKAFFRRNALSGLSTLQCRYMNENCTINCHTRRDCSFCRLRKCFQVGMRKEFILTDKLKRIKQEKILANRRQILNSIQPMNSFEINKYSQLNDCQRQFLTHIYNAFEEYTRLPMIDFEQTEYNHLVHQPIKSRIKLSHYIDYYDKSRMFLMKYFQCLPEYKQLTDVEQEILVNRNCRFLIRISTIETFNENISLWPSINLLLQTIFGTDLITEFTHTIQLFKNEINDSICIRLVLIISFFSLNFLNNIDTIKIYRIQQIYIELLWCYLKQRYNEIIACQYIIIIIRHCLHLQTIGYSADQRRIQAFQPNSFLLPSSD